MRRAIGEGDRVGGPTIDSLLYGRLCVAHSDAEEHYLRLIALAGDAMTATPGMTLNAAVWERFLAEANGKAQGLALAIAIISGNRIEEVRERAQQRCEDRRVQP